MNTFASPQSHSTQVNDIHFPDNISFPVTPIQLSPSGFTGILTGDERALCDWLTTWGQPKFAAFTIVGQDRVTTTAVWFGSDPYTATRWGAITLHWIEYEPKQYK